MFLKGDKKTKAEIEEYANIEIEWKRGKHAVMTIFDDEDKEIEQIKLYELKTRDEMHQLMVDKGFPKKTTAQKAADIQLALMETQQRATDGAFLAPIHFMICAVIAGGFYSVLAKLRSKSTCCAPGSNGS